MSSKKQAQEQDLSFIQEALPAFRSEAQEQTAQMESLLLQIEDEPDNRDLLDALFRCAHTVKGSAGIFGLNAVVAFTHHVETLLDLMREGKVTLSQDLSTLLLRCNDQIRLLVDETGGDEEPSQQELRAELVAQLQLAAGLAPVGPNVALEDAELEPEPPSRREGLWHISARFGVDTFRNGMDPLAITSYLAGLGDITSIICDTQGIPDLEHIDPESCHLSLEIELCGETTQDDIEGAFSFVKEDSQIAVLQPTSNAEHFIDLIHAQPENPRLGDILIAIGAITRAQLKAALNVQEQVQRETPEGVTPQLPRLGQILRDTAGVEPQVIEAAIKKQQKAKETGNPDDARFIRVHADRLDAVINLLGELVIAGAGASLLAHQTRHATLVESMDQIGHLIEEIRNGTLQLRMVQIGETFSRFRRVVRDTASDLGKNVVLDIHGAETELDKSVVERIADPLMHLVRNSLDHGLETPEDRVAIGKPEQGHLTLSACHESGSILIRIEDDGRGIRRDKVLERAWQRGLVPMGVTPPDNEILQLIFAAGFSTAEKVTNLSGRGVGMDVVKRNIEALRGTVLIQSKEGQGTRIDIRLPLTLAIIDGFLVGVGPSKFIFPLDCVVEVIEDRHNDLRVDNWGRTCVELRGQMLSVVSLRQLYGLQSPVPERGSVIVIQSGERRFGVMVDQLMGQHQTVIKPMGRMFRSLRGISGSSILGTGEVALIFDVSSLGELAATDTANAGRSAQGAADPKSSVAAETSGAPP